LLTRIEEAEDDDDDGLGLAGDELFLLPREEGEGEEVALLRLVFTGTRAMG